MNAAEAERLRTWAIPIAEALLPEVTRRDEGNEVRFPDRGGLTINRHSGAWYQHATGQGSWSALALIQLLGYPAPAEALKWAMAWLGAHPGTGPSIGAHDDEDNDSPSKSDAEIILCNTIEITGTPAERYLSEHRRIDPPYPPDLKYLPNARCGEGALVAPLYSHERITGIQVTYLDMEGRKSVVSPQRRRFNLEKAPDAVFLLPYTGENTNVVIAEGLEDALSVWRYGALRCHVRGIPGVGVLQHLVFASSTKITVLPDGGPADSAPAKALQRGLDRLLLPGCEVLVAEIPAIGFDTNRILIEDGVDALQKWIEEAQPATLSLRGEIEKLAKLDEIDWEQQRQSEATRLKIRIKILDKLVIKARAAAADAADDAKVTSDTRPWPTAVDGAALLDELARTLAGFVNMEDEQSWAVALWVVFTHAFDVAPFNPKLWFKSPTPRSGKTRIMEVLFYLVNRALIGSRVTPAAMFRLMDLRQPTLLLDEVDTYLQD
jgi:hypothetical protein